MSASSACPAIPQSALQLLKGALGRGASLIKIISLRVPGLSQAQPPARTQPGEGWAGVCPAVLLPGGLRVVISCISLGWHLRGLSPLAAAQGCWGKASANYLQHCPDGGTLGGLSVPWGQQHMALVAFLLPLCPPLTPQAAFAHLALAFRCDLFTLQQRVQVERRARDAAEENIQEELGQCRAALEVGGHQGRGLARAGINQPQRGLDNSEWQLQQLHPFPPQRLGRSCASAGCKETLEQLQHNLAVLAAAVERATSAAEKLGAVHQVCPQPSVGVMEVLQMGLGIMKPHPWACWGLSLLLTVLVLTSHLCLAGCKGSIHPALGVGRGCTCTPWCSLCTGASWLGHTAVNYGVMGSKPICPVNGRS